MALKEHLTAGEAAAELEVSPATLYAYVSRGLIRSEASADTRRKRLYRREDIAMLKDLKEARRNPTGAAERSLSWGPPLLESGLTLISDGRLYYRGLDATQLAATRTVEEVAALMWQGGIAPAGAEPFQRAPAGLACSAPVPCEIPAPAP